jgi:hypothetical protein
MSEAQPINTQDLAAAMTALALGFTAAIMSPRHQTENEVLEALANELDDIATRAPNTAAAEALKLCVAMLLASEPKL